MTIQTDLLMYRCEKKLDVDKYNLIHFYNFIKKNNLKSIYKDRYILSYYFDNQYFDMYNHSEEGILPRKKIRIRSYPKKNDHNRNMFYNLETKISDYTGRSKRVKKIQSINKSLKYGIFDKQYGKCNMVSSIWYRRKYFTLKNFRITVDDRICFKNNTKSIFFENIQVEIKFNQNLIDDYYKYFPFRERRFSKYCESIKQLYYK